MSRKSLLLGIVLAMLVGFFAVVSAKNMKGSVVSVNGCNAGYTFVNGQCVKGGGSGYCNAGYTYVNGQCLKSGGTTGGSTGGSTGGTTGGYSGNCNAGYRYVNGTCIR